MNLECILLVSLVGLFGTTNPELSFKVFQTLSIIWLNWMHSVFCWLGLNIFQTLSSEYSVFCWLGGAEEGHAPTGRAMASAA